MLKKILISLVIITITFASAYAEVRNQPKKKSLENKITAAMSIEYDWGGPMENALKGRSPKEYIPIFIKIAIKGRTAEIRGRAADELQHFYTDNGADGYLYIEPLEKGLDDLLMGLKKTETLRPIVTVLGSRPAGDSFAPCYMSTESRKKIIIALKMQLETIHAASEEFRRKPNAPWDNEWTFAKNEIEDAIENTNKCNLTNQ